MLQKNHKKNHKKLVLMARVLTIAALLVCCLSMSVFAGTGSTGMPTAHRIKTTTVTVPIDVPIDVPIAQGYSNFISLSIISKDGVLKVSGTIPFSEVAVPFSGTAPLTIPTQGQIYLSVPLTGSAIYEDNVKIILNGNVSFKVTNTFSGTCDTSFSQLAMIQIPGVKQPPSPPTNVSNVVTGLTFDSKIDGIVSATKAFTVPIEVTVKVSDANIDIETKATGTATSPPETD